MPLHKQSLKIIPFLWFEPNGYWIIFMEIIFLHFSKWIVLVLSATDVARAFFTCQVFSSFEKPMLSYLLRNRLMFKSFLKTTFYLIIQLPTLGKHLKNDTSNKKIILHMFKGLKLSQFSSRTDKYYSIHDLKVVNQFWHVYFYKYYRLRKYIKSVLELNKEMRDCWISMHLGNHIFFVKNHVQHHVTNKQKSWIFVTLTNNYEFWELKWH